MSLIRSLIDSTVGMLGGFFCNRKVRPDVTISDGRVCVNLGCGLAIAPGWINVDASLNALFSGAPKFILAILYRLSGANRYYDRETYCALLKDHRFVFHDLAKSLPFTKETVDIFYSSHFFEHLFQKDACRLLKEMRIALKKGGTIRIAVPDLAYAVKLYNYGEKQKMLENYFFVNDRHSFLASHKYMYDFELLAEQLKNAGYSDIRLCGYRVGQVPDLEYLDNRAEETLFVEASI